MTDITAIVQALILLLCAIITYVLVPFIRSRTTLSQQQEISDYVQIAVQAAEQIFRDSGKGKDKKAYVLEWLKERNITVDDSKIDAMIESAVHELNSGVVTLSEPINAIGFEIETETVVEEEESDE